LVYLHQNTLFAAPFDLSRLAVTGPFQLVLEDVGLGGLAGSENFDFSQSETFVYHSRNREFQSSLSWLAGAGKTQPLHVATGFYSSPRFSPDGRHLAFVTNIVQGRGDIWVRDLERDTTSHLTSQPGPNAWPVWTPDGRNIVFESEGQAAPGIYWIRSDGAGEAQRLTDGKTQQVPYSFSPDGKRLAYTQRNPDGHAEIWTARVESDGGHPRFGKAEPFLRFLGTPFVAISPAFSPDGRWLAYTSSETGAYEIYVRPFPGPGGKSQISTRGGRWPIWSRYRHKLFFLTLDGHIMVASYNTKGDSFVPGKPQVWSETRLLADPLSTYDLAPDGKRFAVVLYPGRTEEQEQKATDSVTVLLNFFDELKRRVPAGEK
jgi:serine/threonine-protein kinase